MLDSRIAVVYVAKNSIVGFCGISGVFNYLTINVEEDYRNMGIGKILLERMIVEEKKRGIGFLTLIVSSNNPVAIKLFTEFRFKEIARYSRYFRERDRYVDYEVMFLAISRRERFISLLFRMALYQLPKAFFSATIAIMQRKPLSKVMTGVNLGR